MQPLVTLLQRRMEEEVDHLRKEVASEKDKMRKVVDKLKKTHLDFVHFKEDNKELQAKVDCGYISL